jgi:hypothetical protein
MVFKAVLKTVLKVVQRKVPSFNLKFKESVDLFSECPSVLTKGQMPLLSSPCFGWRV